MYEILKKRELNCNTTLIEIAAPYVAKKAEPGQFIILRACEEGERIPLTIADYNREKGSVTVIYQVVGATTEKLNHLQEGDSLVDVAGPLGRASELAGLKKVAVVGGGLGCAIAYPIAKKLYEMGTEVHLIVGFRNRDAIILEEEYQKVCHKLYLMTDDGSYGEKGLVTDALQQAIHEGEKFDEVIAIGPIVMMKFVSLLTQKYQIKTVVSMNPVMIDGTGMCGGCRLSVGGEMKFACVDGPEFDGHLVDFDEAMNRNRLYQEFERHAYEETCSLFHQKNEGV